MNELLMIAQRLKGLRLSVDKSEQALADAAGVSLEQYRLAEQGQMDFNFTFLYRCAEELGVDVSQLVSGETATLSTLQVVRRGEGLSLDPRRYGFKYSNLAFLKKNKLSQPYHVTVEHTAELENSPIRLTQHAGEEFDYVLKGTLKVQVGEHTEVLNEGDCIYYDSSKPHGMVAVGGDCEFLAMVMHGDGEVHMPKPVEDAPIVSYDYSQCIYHKYVTVKEDEQGRLLDISFNAPHNFNFAFDVMEELAKKTPNKRAMLWLSQQKEVRDFSFGELSRLSSQAANYFSSIGIKKGDKVMLILQRQYQFWVAILALMKLGAVAVPATHLLVAHDLEYRFNAAGISAVVATHENDIPNQVEIAMKTSPTMKHKIITRVDRDGWQNFDTEIAKHSDVFERRTGKDGTASNEHMLMYFTSGTTGYPKITAHNHLYALGHLVTARYWHQVDPNGLHFTISDTGWGKAAWGKLFGQWLCEAPIFTYNFDKFEATDLLPMFKEHNITTFCAPPTMFRFFIKENLANYDLSSLKHTTIAGEALNPEVYEQWLKFTGLKLTEGFGQTETTLVLANLVGCEPKPGSMGKATPLYNVELLDNDGQPVKVGEVGEICINTKKSTPCGLFTGYYRDTEKTNKAWHDGYYHTGDMAWVDEDGYYWYMSRMDDVIKSSGYRIGPFEIESVIMELPYVLECAVTGEPDPVRGQVVKATVVLTKGTEKSDRIKQEIQDYVKTNTAPYKYPRIVELVDSLPKTISGKIKRAEIRNSK